MSSINNINNNASVVNVGRTTPVSPGPQPAAKSIPVVIATDQNAIPVEEQNKIQSEVALSLLGIPRSEVALGIFADVNTYDVNPSEWSFSPLDRTYVQPGSRTQYAGIAGVQGWGISHLPEESGALVEAPADETAILTSKRFFRYQPGRVSSATFGIKSTFTTGNINSRPPHKNPPIRKYGIFDKFDGYYWETRDTSQGDQFAVVRRTQSIIRYNPLPFGTNAGQQVEDTGLGGKSSDIDRSLIGAYSTARDLIRVNRTSLIANSATNTDPKCLRDLDFVIDAYINDLKYGGDGHISVNATTYRTALLLGENDEETQHTNLRDNIVSLLNLENETAAASRITILSAIQINAVNGTQPTIANINYDNRPKIETIFSIYNKYLGYIVSSAIVYDTSSPVRDLSATEYEAFLIAKCIRDVKFAINAYSTDLLYGGNAATVYNAKKYYSNNELQVYSQTSSGGAVQEKESTEYLKQLISSSSTVNVVRANGSSIQIASVVDLFNLSETQRTKLQTLINITIDNYDQEYTAVVNFGSAEQFGDVVILRDGLIMTHAALYDPSLLKPREKAIATVDTSANTVTTQGRSVIISQYVNYYGDAAGLIDGKTYYVYDVRGTKANVMTLVDPMDGNFPEVINPVVITSSGTKNYIETPVPFIFPDDYDNAYAQGDTKYDGMFPYLYTLSGVLPAGANDFTRGAVDTAIDTSVSAADLKAQIDAVNLKYKSWVRDHVDQTYYSVYEFRVPRSRFSGDSLNGESRRAVYADNVLDKKAGEFFVEGGLAIEQQSNWDYDFSKVTMLKIDFSWYGAVGALFLAYVPVGNGQARWIRVHHLRCSNQLKISSLGNATLPITYLVYGGGSESRLGPLNADRLPSNYSSYSENIVKYGASYYIDGGDRGTVRIYNHSSQVPTEVYGSRYAFTINSTNVTDPYEPRAVVTGLNGAPAISTFYINASVITGNTQDQNVKVTWVDISTNTIFFNKVITSVSSINIIVDRPTQIYGLKTKKVITSGEEVDVRNRVQVYPTRLSIGTSGTGSGKLSLLKTPLFQTNVITVGNLSTVADIDINEINELPVNNNLYLSENGDFVYGYFRGFLRGATAPLSILGKLEKQNDNILFTPNEIYNGDLIIASGSSFLKEGIFDSQGNTVQATESAFEKERLSSIRISQVSATPIPTTGIEIASYYTSTGAQDFDLGAYFDYNKEYISFPLTDELQTLYLSSASREIETGSPLLLMSASLTWEEQ